jgi:hypothetical protein
MKDSTRLTIGMRIVFPLAWLSDKLASLFDRKWRDISKGNPK